MQRDQIISEIMASINAMKNKLHARTMSLGHTKGIPHSQWFVLCLIERCPDMGIKEISGMLGITSSATTQLVDELVKNGYVTRKTNSNDKRSLCICLSKKGQKNMAVMKKKYMDVMKRIFSSLSDKELETYNNLHKKILSNS